MDDLARSFTMNVVRRVRHTNPPPEERGYVDQYDAVDGLHALFQGAAAVGLFLAFLLVLWLSHGWYSHWYEVQASCLRRVEPEYALKQRLVSSFCDSNPLHDRSAECIAARDYLRIGIQHRVFDMVVAEHLDMLPFVSHCRHTSDCRSMMFSLNESVKSSLWYVCVILAIAVGWALVVAVKTTLGSCCRVNREMYRRRRIALPTSTKQCD